MGLICKRPEICAGEGQQAAENRSDIERCSEKSQDRFWIARSEISITAYKQYLKRPLRKVRFRDGCQGYSYS
jgi:hypothetical protein